MLDVLQTSKIDGLLSMIYFLNFQYNPNTAAENRLQAYYKALDKMNIKAQIVYVHPDGHYNKVSEKYNNISIEYLWSPFMLYRGIFRRITLFKYLRKFLKRLKRGDIVYTYNVSLMTKMCQEIDGIRVFAERTEHPQASDGFPHPLLSLNNQEYLETVKRLDGLFVISESLKEYYSKLGLDQFKIMIINMTVDPSRFINVHKTPGVEKYIAYCGTASNNKDGVDQLIKAFAIVVKKHPEYKLYIIGKTPSKLQRFGNQELVKELQLENNVVFTGVISFKEMPQILMNASALALDRPNNLQAKYGFPTKLGEYLLTGNPVVVTRVGDIPLFLNDMESALIAEPENPHAFADKLNWVIEHPRESKLIGKNGKRIAMENFNYLIETKKIVEIIM